MSRPTLSERPRSSGRTYTDDEWESVKHNFQYYYMEKNMSLKDAARCMSEIHGFDATLRQWERRIAPEKWGFSKYASRDDRLKAIDASGKSLLDVSQRGRRRSTASDGRPSLTEDRNLRRFARREVSREARRPRASSVSVLSDQSDQEMDDTSVAPSPAPSDSVMDSQDVPSFSQPSFDLFGDQWVTASSQDSAMPLPQIRVFDQSQTLAVPAINISGPDDSYIAPDHIPMSLQAQVNVQYPTNNDGHGFAPFHAPASDRFTSVQVQSDAFITNEMSPHIDSDMGWNDSLTPEGPRPAQVFPSFAFDSNNSISYTDMLQLGSQDLQNAVASIDNHTNNRFGPEASRLQNSNSSFVDALELYQDFEDPTYVDVFAVLKERDDKILQMISMLKRTCEESTDTEHTKSHVVSRLTLLEKGVRDQNNESERDVRRTLKNITSTKLRATQYIHDLSMQRKRKIEQLQAQINALNANQQHAYPYG